MRASLVCIGGECHGQRFVVDDQYPEVRIPEAGKYQSALEPVEAQQQSTTMHVYTVRKLRFSSPFMLAFLAPQGMSDFDALSYLFTHGLEFVRG